MSGAFIAVFVVVRLVEDVVNDVAEGAVRHMSPANRCRREGRTVGGAEPGRDGWQFGPDSGPAQ